MCWGQTSSQPALPTLLISPELRKLLAIPLHEEARRNKINTLGLGGPSYCASISTTRGAGGNDSPPSHPRAAFFWRGLSHAPLHTLPTDPWTHYPTLQMRPLQLAGAQAPSFEGPSPPGVVSSLMGTSTSDPPGNGASEERSEVTRRTSCL